MRIGIFCSIHCMDNIYNISSDNFKTLDSKLFESEKELQNLIIKYPELLSFLSESKLTPVLISDEVRISTGRIDNFLVDNEAIPILIEVKERSNVELKRKVVGQLLDYASTISNDLTEMNFEEEIISSCRKHSFDEIEVLNNLYQNYEKEEFWEIFSKNLKNNRFKLVVLADKFYPSTERIIQYLNQETKNTNFIGLELMKFEVDESTLIVPKLIGSTYFSSNSKLSSKSLNDENVFLEQISTNKVTSSLDLIDQIDEWAVEKQLHFKYNDGKTATRQYRLDNDENTLLCSTTSKGEISFRLGELAKILSTEGFKKLFKFLEITFGTTIFTKPKDEEVGPHFASIPVSNITQSELNKLLEKLEGFFEL